MTRRMFPARSLPSLAAAVLLAGCASTAPPYERPAAPVAAAFPWDSASGAASGTAASDIEWQHFFGDARLKGLIEIALRNNRDLRVAVLNIEQARAQYQVRRADELPTVGIGANATRQASAPGRIGDLYTAGLSVIAYELDFFGRVRSLSDAALASYLGTAEARKAAQIALISTVANTYLNLQADEELLAVTRQALVTREESLKLTRLKFDVGAASELDYRQAESLLEGARATLAQFTRQRALDENALVLLLGQPLPAGLPQGLAVTSQQLVPDLPAGLPSEVLARRPDVRQAEQQLIAANANIGAARAAFFPKISLTGSVGTASTELSGLFKGGSFAWSFIPQLLVPIFDAGRNQANLDVAVAGRDIAVAQYEKAVQTAFREVADSLAGRATLDEQARAQQAQAQAEAVRYKLADLRYRNGAASYLDVLDAQRSLFIAQQAVVQVQAARVQNLVGLYKALGGGWTGDASKPQP
ncbi:MAG: efflux transporter outer membrane subunit [Proteobacteria bacterium]|nr:efflux transporter outer membrane subunit [Pseudomonadota bacterium]